MLICTREDAVGDNSVEAGNEEGCDDDGKDLPLETHRWMKLAVVENRTVGAEGVAMVDYVRRWFRAWFLRGLGA